MNNLFGYFNDLEIRSQCLYIKHLFVNKTLKNVFFNYLNEKYKFIKIDN